NSRSNRRLVWQMRRGDSTGSRLSNVLPALKILDDSGDVIRLLRGAHIPSGGGASLLRGGVICRDEPVLDWNSRCPLIPAAKPNGRNYIDTAVTNSFRTWPFTVRVSRKMPSCVPVSGKASSALALPCASV